MKRKGLLSILTVFMVVIISLSLYGCGDSTDYVETVKRMAPYDNATYGAVLDKYISSCNWQERIQSKELVYVDASGKMTDVDGSEMDVAITLKVTPYEGKTDGMVWIEPYIVELDKDSYSDEEAAEFVAELFEAYSQNYNTFAEYLATTE